MKGPAIHGKSALRNAFRVEKGVIRYPKDLSPISIRVRTDAVAGSRRHIHADGFSMSAIMPASTIDPAQHR